MAGRDCLCHTFNSRIRAEYGEEKEELGEILAKLEEVEVVRSALEAENKIEADRRRSEELWKIRRIVAVKALQKHWRNYKTRMLLKSKKKRRKKTQQKLK